MAGPLCGLKPSKDGRMSGLKRIPVVLRPDTEGQNLARTRSRRSSTLAPSRSAVPNPRGTSLRPGEQVAGLAALLPRPGEAGCGAQLRLLALCLLDGAPPSARASRAEGAN